MNEIGFIKLHRQILNWEWYSDINTTRLFIHLLLTANYEPKKWQGIDIARGSLITSYPKLSEQTSLTVQQTRTALNKLKSTGEITASKGLNYTLISITCYDDYQSINTLDNRQITDNQQSNNRQITATKEIKNIRSKEVNKLYDDWFENFWEHYTPIKCNGRFVAKGNKQTAREKFIKILEKGKTDYETIMRGLESYIRHCQANNQLTCQAVVWLNQERWLDDYGSTVDSKGGLRERQEPKSVLAIHAEIEDEIRHRPDLQGEWD